MQPGDKVIIRDGNWANSRGTIIERRETGSSDFNVYSGSCTVACLERDLVVQDDDNRHIIYKSRKA
jgi:hypothetical protein